MTTTIAPETTPAAATDAGTLVERATARAWVEREIQLAEERGEVEDGVLPDYLAELLQHADDDLRAKAERAGIAAKRLEFDADAIKAEIDRLAKRLAMKHGGVERLKGYLRFCLELAGETKVETPLVTVAIQSNGGAQPIRWTRAVADLPEAFRRLPAEPWTLNTAAAQAHFKAHGALPDGFEVLPRGTSLRIR